MKSFVAFLALVAVAAADVSQVVRTADANAQIIVQDADVLPDQYQYKYQTSNGISGQERGVLQNAGREDEGIAVEGENAYTGDDGQVYALRYKADINGYQPEGAHLPIPHPIPEYIIRAINYINSRTPEQKLRVQ